MRTWLRRHIKNWHYLVLRKYYVFVAGRITGAPLWRLIIHDWSKFTFKEWKAYSNFFYGNNDQVAFRKAWLSHIHRNPHHREHHTYVQKSGKVKVLDIPWSLVKEMVADWAGAGRVINGKWEVYDWYLRNCKHIKLTFSTRMLVHYELEKFVPPGRKIEAINRFHEIMMEVGSK